MHALLRIVAIVTLCSVALTAAAKDDTAKKSAAPSATAQQNADHAAAKKEGQADQWRFRQHNGRWWYWTPKNQWVVYQNNEWVPYRAGMFASADRSVRRYSYAPGEQVQGNFYPRIYRAPRVSGANRSIRYAGSKINADYAPYTGGSMQ